MSTANDSTPPIVLQLTKTLVERPPACDVMGTQLRPFEGEQDIDIWLGLRDRAFARERVGVGVWTHDDFHREFLDKWWWQPERLWFAELLGDGATVPRVVGTVTLADRGSEAEPRPVVHWLAVLPQYRRCGMARALMAALETHCWDRGWKHVALETHRKWQRAIAFYEELGYSSQGEGAVTD